MLKVTSGVNDTELAEPLAVRRIHTAATLRAGISDSSTPPDDPDDGAAHVLMPAGAWRGFRMASACAPEAV